MGDMLNKKFWGGGDTKKIDFLRAISHAERSRIFF